MFGRSRERIRENAASASELALQLAQDKKFRKRLLSAIEHSSEAGRRARRGLGLGGAIARLATDDTLLRELRGARRDLEHAYGRLERKRRSHKLRKMIVLASLASLAGIPALRRRAASVIGQVLSPRRPAESDVRADRSSTSDDSGAGPKLEDLTKEELYARAQAADIPGRSEMSKEELVEALRGRG
jgi:hypothetical protein